MTDIRIYVASLMDYNAGILHGVWIDATLDPDEIYEQVKTMLAASPEAACDFSKKWGLKAEEWAIHDYEGFGELTVHEYEQFDWVSGIAQLIEDHDAGVLCALVQLMGETDAGELERMIEGYSSFDSWTDAIDDQRSELYDLLENTFGEVPWGITVADERLRMSLKMNCAWTENKGTIYHFPEAY